ELVADRIVRFAELVGRERVMAGTDCGLGGRIHPHIARAQLGTLAPGAGPPPPRPPLSRPPGRTPSFPRGAPGARRGGAAGGGGGPGGGGGGGGERWGGVGPPRPVRRPRGGDSGQWVTQLERSPTPDDGPLPVSRSAGS